MDVRRQRLFERRWEFPGRRRQDTSGTLALSDPPESKWVLLDTTALEQERQNARAHHIRPRSETAIVEDQRSLPHLKAAANRKWNFY